ncbi:hypothetical protein B0H17DRAFT_1194309 [Mycena rosella]|uniref:Velvet domain-containing protein n=1 Tax=Mycena rosella TaxID=1033263 RepID=A0AAD7E1K5_MYCRO|nr:hypothetical protein B0H17DRAFT_1194309 [Mycena rosella]
MNVPRAQICEIQSPIDGRKSSRGDPRRLDPHPIVHLVFTPGREIHPSRLFCQADLFRVPDNPHLYPSEYTYYADQKVVGRDGLPIFALAHTPYPNWDLVLAQVGNHLLTVGSAESHLLIGRQPVQAYLKPGSNDILFLVVGLSVQQLGRYVLRYTVYEENGALLATCLGQKFDVLPAGQYSGLRSSTHLTNSMAQLNIPGLRRRA